MMCSYKKSRDAGVSPVVGVMLMLVVTIIIAAVVSAFSGGLMSNQKTAPTATLDIHLRNDGTGNSYFMMKVLSVSEPISTRDLKIVTSWVNATGGTGGATVLPNSNNTYYHSYKSGSWAVANSPAGYGPGIALFDDTASSLYRPTTASWFGNYSWTSGTVMINWPPNYGYPAVVDASTVGATPYHYWPIWYNAEYIGGGGNEVDALTAVLGLNWNTLRPGDKLTVKVIHIPTGKVIVNQQGTVEG